MTASLDDLIALIENDYAVNGRKTAPRIPQATRHLRQFFGSASADKITPARVSAYIAARLAQDAKPATVKIELGMLGRMFTLAYRAGMVPSRPPFPTIQVRNTRTDFFEERHLRAVLAHLPDYMRPLVLFAYFTGWRRGEAIGLTWKAVDFRAKTVRLETSTTKNDEGRTFPCR